MPAPPAERSLEDLLAAAVEIVEAAGPVALRHFRRPLAVANKDRDGGFDPVTAADREVERFVRRQLEERFPDDGILGEEEGVEHGRSERRWVLDPIDGTRAFISGVPLWGILLGLTEGERSLLGAVHQPYTEETFYGTRRGSWLRRSGRSDGAPVPLRARATRKLADAVLYTTHPDTFVTPESRRGFDRVAAACRLMRFGGDCYSYCLLALGCIDLIVEDSLEPFDVIPLIPILEGAGAVVTNGRGGSADLGGLVVAAATRELHRQALDLLRHEA